MEIKKLLNRHNKMDGLELLDKIDKKSIKAVFFDPQYRGILDKMAYGNEGVSRGKQRSELPQMGEDVILSFLKKIEWILQDDGYLFLWIDKFHLVEGIKPWLSEVKTLAAVDMIVWNKQKIGMGYRTRRKCEYLVIIQKEPRHAKKTWTIHNIPDVWDETVKKNHPHAKPVELQKALISAVTNKNDLVCDPAAGGYSVFNACKDTGRRFIGCDLVFGEEI